MVPEPVRPQQGVFPPKTPLSGSYPFPPSLESKSLGFLQGTPSPEQGGTPLRVLLYRFCLWSTLSGSSEPFFGPHEGGEWTRGPRPGPEGPG